MHDPLEPKNKRERKRWNYHKLGMTGQVPWNSRGIEECMRHMHQRYSEMTEEERKDYDAYIVALAFIRGKYGQTKGSLYFQRMGAIISFMQHYRDRLKEDKFITTDAEGATFWEDNLMEAFARLPFTMQSFKYDDVTRYVERCKKPS